MEYNFTYSRPNTAHFKLERGCVLYRAPKQLLAHPQRGKEMTNEEGICAR